MSKLTTVHCFFLEVIPHAFAGNLRKSRVELARECGGVGVPDDELGEVVWAYVAVRNPVTPGELQQFVRQQIAPYKVPETIRFLDELPKGVTGKVHRRSLRERARTER